MNLCKVAVVTGAARGIGRTIAKELLIDKYVVVLVDRDAITLKQTKADFEQAGMRCEAISIDVSDETSCQILISRLQESMGRVDLLVNNAAISPKAPNNHRSSVTEISVEEWDQVITVNLRSVFLLSSRMYKLLSHTQGNIVNIASMMGVVGAGSNNANIFPYSTSGAHYCASKAGVINLTKSLAREFAVQQVRVNCVSPGAVVGGMGAFSEDLIAKLKTRIPLNSLCKPDDIASAVRYLALADYVTGANIHVNGGWFMD